MSFKVRLKLQNFSKNLLTKSLKSEAINAKIKLKKLNHL